MQPWFVADPVFENCPDPLPQRWFLIEGKHECVRPNILSAEAVQQLFGHAPGSKAPSRPSHRAPQQYTLSQQGEPIPLRTGFNFPEASAACEEMIGDGDDLAGFHEPIRAATYRKAKEAIVLKLPFDRDAYITHLTQVVLSAPRGNRKVGEIESRVKDIPRMLDGALRRVLQQEAARQASYKTCVPRFPEQALPIAEAQIKIKDILAEFVALADAFHAQQQVSYEDIAQGCRDVRRSAASA